MLLLTETTFLYTSIHHSLSVEQYLLPSFKTQLGLNTLQTVSLSGKLASHKRISFECLRCCFELYCNCYEHYITLLIIQNCLSVAQVSSP